MTKENKKDNKAISDKIELKWFLIDAENLILGRLSSFIATRLMGKQKTSYSPDSICGDRIIVVNAKKVKLTGKKYDKKKFWHTGYPGGIKSKTYKEILNSENPTLLLRNCVQNMLKNGPLGKQQLKNLYIYPNIEHPHMGQNPTKLSLNK